MVALRGTVRARGVLTGTVSPSMTLPRYPGPYDVTPSADAQVLATKGLAMSADVTVGGMGDAIEEAERDAMRSLVDGSFTGEYRDEELTKVNNSALAYITGLTSVELPAATSVGSNAFQGCTGLTSVELPAVTQVGNNAFQDCAGLTEVNLPALVGNTPDGRCTNSFMNCTSLRRLDLPSFSWLGGNQTFMNCSALEYLHLGKSIDCSGWHMFYGLSSLRTVDFGSLRSLRSGFNDSALLDTLIIRTPDYACTTTSANNIPPGCPIANGTGYIYVPRALVDKYKVATNWSVYADQFRAIEDYPDICDPDE